MPYLTIKERDEFLQKQGQLLRIACRYIPEDAAENYIQNIIDQPPGLYGVVLSTSRIRTWRMPVQGEPAQGIWHDRYWCSHKGEGTKLKTKAASPASG